MKKMLVLKDSDERVIGEIYTFSYNAKRMGGAPTISATFYSFDENTVGRDCYVEFNGEKYYINQTPTSSKKNDEARYKYDLEFVSERYTLDNIYFCDSSFGSVSNTTEFLFGGTVRDLADKIQLSIDSSYGEGGNGYKIIVDAGVDDENTDWKSIEFKNVSVMNAIQEFYNTFKHQYYYYSYEDFDGNYVREFHVGEPHANNIDETLKYGVDESLLSITRTNANYKAINKITGVGSTDNIPYYYPNESPDGQHDFVADESFGEVKINYLRLSKKINLQSGAKLTYNFTGGTGEIGELSRLAYFNYSDSGVIPYYVLNRHLYASRMLKVLSHSFTDTLHFAYDSKTATWVTPIDASISHYGGNVWSEAAFEYALSIVGSDTETNIKSQKMEVDFGDWLTSEKISEGRYRFKGGTAVAFHELKIKISVELDSNSIPTSTTYPINCSLTCRIGELDSSKDYFSTEDGKKIDVKDSGISVETPFDGGVIEISQAKNYIAPQKRLMPPIYKETYGKERFYKASNSPQVVQGIAPDQIDGEDVRYRYEYLFGGYGANGAVLPNEYIEGRQVEHILEVDDIKPTIKGTTSLVNGVRFNIDSFDAFDYDDDDNDEFGENGYKHPYFYARLKPLGFNLFDCANEQDEMTVSMTSGDCIACNFVIAVDEKTSENVVAVDSSNSIIKEEGKVVLDRTRAKQDTTSEHVWIALRKDEDTYGILYPNAENNMRPSPSDTFVLVNINLPNSYVRDAEMRLENEIKSYLRANNSEKFNFSVKFSRIYLHENKDVRMALSENSKVSVEYFGETYNNLYVSSYTYKMSDGDALPEISIELANSLSTSKGVLQNIASQVKIDVLSSVESANAAQNARALRKDQNDQTPHRLSARELLVSSDMRVNRDTEVGGELNVKSKATFKDAIDVKGSVVVGGYTNVLGEIEGAKIDETGNAYFNSITANILEVFTLIYNQVRSTSAYTAFDDSGTITEIQELLDERGNSYLKITFEEDKSSYNHHFEDGDILFGYVNQLNNFGYSRAGKCWLNVTQAVIEDEPWSLYAIMFPEDECEDNKNIPPTTNMVVMHKGNNSTRLNDDGTVTYWNKERQRTFYISSKDGHIVQLLDVTSPKLYTLMSSSNPNNYSNYGVVLGKLPDDLFKYVNKYYSFVKAEDPVVYAKYLAVQNLLQIDYAGRPIKTARYRGYWSETIAKGLLVNDGEDKYNNTSTIYDTVTHNGSMWMCQVHETEAEPQDNIYDWKKIVTKGDDSVLASYDILPTTTALYFQPERNALSANKIDVVIGETTVHGYTRIDDQVLLDERGLTVLYSIDGGDKVPFSISDSGALALEDGTGLLVLEDGGGIWLEGGDIDAAQIRDNITIHLVKNYGEEDEVYISMYVIPVTLAGTFKATAFKRSSIALSSDDVPKNYTYNQPYDVENGWFDGLPSGSDTVYSSTCTFYGNGTDSGWSAPMIMADNPDFEVMYSDRDIKPTIPAITADGKGWWNSNDWWILANSYGWSDDVYTEETPEGVKNPKWMATNNRHSGEAWTNSWVVSRVEGEKGEYPNDNFIENSNFEQYEDDKTTLRSWIAQNGQVIPNHYEGLNAFQSDPVEGWFLGCHVNALRSTGYFTLTFSVWKTSTDLSLVVLTYEDENDGNEEVYNLPAIDIIEAEGEKISFGGFEEGSVYNILIDVPNNEWCEVSIVFNVKQATSYNWRMFFHNENGGSIAISKPKLEYGDKSTPYLKSQNDLAGPAGEVGNMIYPAGIWDEDREYRIENKATPFVYYEGTYYILQVEESIGNNPSESSDWRRFQSFDFMYAEFLMANQARFGSKNGGVFYDNLLFSARMKAKDTYYNSGTVDPNGSEESKVPMLALDFRDGKLYAEEAKIRGHIEATSGEFTGKIAANSGTIDSITATNLSVSSGKIGDFKIEGGIFNGEVYDTTGEGTHARGVYMTKDFIRLRYNKRVDGPDNKETYWQMQLGTQPQATNQADGLYLERVYSGTAVDAVYKPQIKLKSTVASAGGNGISILADGSILSKGAVVSLGTQGGFFSTSERLSIDKGCVLFIPYNAQYDCYLPKVGELNKYFGSKTYSVEFKLVVCPYMLNSGSKFIYLRGDAESDLELTYDYVGDDTDTGGIMNRSGYARRLNGGNVYSIFVCSSNYGGGSNIGYTGQVVYMHVSQIG